MSVGKQIKKCRNAIKLSQKELGERLGVSQAMIAQYESGKRIPKLETIDKIASALNVPIAQIKEDITWGELQSTSEIKQLDREASTIEGVIAILTDIYGKVESKSVRGKYSEGHYYLIGEGKEQFVLYDGDIDTLYKSAKASIPVLVDRIKDKRPEHDIIAEYETELNSPEQIARIEKYIAAQTEPPEE